MDLNQRQENICNLNENIKIEFCFISKEDQESIQEVSKLLDAQGEFHNNFYKINRRNPSIKEINNYVVNKLNKGFQVLKIMNSDITVGFSIFSIQEEESNWSANYQDKVLYLEELFIVSSLRGSGVGHKFICFLEDYCRQQDIKKIELICAKGNLNAVDFYKKLGFLMQKEEVIFAKII